MHPTWYLIFRVFSLEWLFARKRECVTGHYLSWTDCNLRDERVIPYPDCAHVIFIVVLVIKWMLAGVQSIRIWCGTDSVIVAVLSTTLKINVGRTLDTLPVTWASRVVACRRNSVLIIRPPIIIILDWIIMRQLFPLFFGGNVCEGKVLLKFNVRGRLFW